MSDNTRQPREIRVDVQSDGDKPVAALAQASGLSKQAVKRAMSRGAVWLGRGKQHQRLRRANRRLRSGDRIHLYYDPVVLSEEPPEPTLIEDRKAYSVWFKPYGMRSQGTRWGDHCTITRWAEQHLLPERIALGVHRLDRAASGLILVAHSRTTASQLSAMFQERVISKSYRARVRGNFPARPAAQRIESLLDDKTAVSEISLMQHRADRSESLVDISIETGRKHQIRRHLASMGYPIIGDRLYGTGVEDGEDLQLTAYRLAFECPVQAEVVEYRLPESFMPALGAD